GFSRLGRFECRSRVYPRSVRSTHPTNCLVPIPPPASDVTRRRDAARTLGFQSSLMLADLMIGHHFSISALWKAPSARGVCCSRATACWPRSASRARAVASASASTTAALSLLTTSVAVPLGTHSAYHDAV